MIIAYFKAFRLDSCSVYMRRGLDGYRRWISTSRLRVYYTSKNPPQIPSFSSYGNFITFNRPICISHKKTRWSRTIKKLR